MKKAYVFPGQGAQFLGMGEEYFDQFPELVSIVDSVLGYSIKELCLQDPHKHLNQTQYTQPALYTVNALNYIAKAQATNNKPDLVAGHSLGEYNALLAAGAFDFETGLKLVQKRGELMGKANQGGMLAVLGIDIGLVREILVQLNDPRIQLANINSAKQTILSGDMAALTASCQYFEQQGAKCVPLKVSAAFHSTYMREARDEFTAYLRGFQFRPLEIPVVANLTAQPYPSINYQQILADQITGTVKWHDTILLMLHSGVEDIEEVGPGNVLTKLTGFIQSAYEDELNSKPEPVAEQPNNLLFMYGGQGFHYRNMGRELFEHSQVFRSAFMECDAMVQETLGVSLIKDLYQHQSNNATLENILVTHPACFSVGYCLTRELAARGIKPAAVLGYSLGEYIAATIAGVVDFKTALRLVCMQARLLKEQAANGRMLAVLTNVADFSGNADDYAGASLACVNYQDNFIISGDHELIVQIRQRLEQRGVLTAILPVAHSFHSDHIDGIRADFIRQASEVAYTKPSINFYSASPQILSGDLNHENLWRAIREPVNFYNVISEIKNSKDYTFIDLSPTASLAAFMDRIFGKHERHRFAINQFGRNLETLNKLVADVKKAESLPG
ncbi:MAG: [acyl-carrier-protein] S-malonyltransferase [Cellvibrio sp. 79]|nr:MAG: [acyl-carrier-protein] S-malonyltransferase [Cellvibrio sp. 79]